MLTDPYIEALLVDEGAEQGVVEAVGEGVAPNRNQFIKWRKGHASLIDELTQTMRPSCDRPPFPQLGH